MGNLMLGKLTGQGNIIYRLGMLEDVLAAVLPVTMSLGSRGIVCHMDN